MGLWTQIKHGWNAFRSRDPTAYDSYHEVGSSRRPDRVRFMGITEQTIVAPIFTRIAVDVSAIQIRHVRVNQNESFQNVINSRLNRCLSLESNRDQAPRAFMQDVVMSMIDDGCVAIVPVETRTTLSGGVPRINDVENMRTAKIIEWYPDRVRVRIYNENTGLKEDLLIPKRECAIVENPFYAIMNEPNSTLKRLIRKLNLLDAIDEQSSSGKLDIIIQLPYTVKSDMQKKRAKERRESIEDQLAGSKYGIAYIDSTERITQLNRAAENNLLAQISYLTRLVYNQLSMTEEVFDGTASENVMLNYMTRTVEPILVAIVEEMQRKFLTRTAIAQLQRLKYFRNPFNLVPASKLADLADRYIRNEIMSPNEFRGDALGMPPSPNPKADELRNRNLNAPSEIDAPKAPDGDKEGE